MNSTRHKTESGIVVVTGQAQVEARIHTLGAGANLFFSKPVDSRELTAAIGHLLLRKLEKPNAVGPPTLCPARALRGWTWLVMERALRTPKGAVVDWSAMLFGLLRLLMAQGGTATRVPCSPNSIRMTPAVPRGRSRRWFIAPAIASPQRPN